MIRPPPRSTLFPSPTLFRSLLHSATRPDVGLGRMLPDILVADDSGAVAVLDAKYKPLAWAPDRPDGVDRGDRYQLVSYVDRKSTRLNSSHLVISYAVFCLKK